MDEAAILNILRTSTEVAQLLERNFDFIPLRAATKSALFHLGEEAHCELIARDASGGEFALCEKSGFPIRPMLYASSEGQAGIIGRSVAEGLATIIDLRCWQDCLKFSGVGQLAEMRRVAPLSEADHQECKPQLNSIRHTLRTRLNLSTLPDPVQALHSAVTELSPLFPAYGSDGSRFRGLFNKFTAMSNAQWRRKLESGK